jgi:hypothetical protein
VIKQDHHSICLKIFVWGAIHKLSLLGSSRSCLADPTKEDNFALCFPFYPSNSSN